MMDKDTRRIISEALSQGFDVRITSKGHIFVTKNGIPVTTFAGTPSDRDAAKKAISALRRHGFQWRR